MTATGQHFRNHSLGNRPRIIFGSAVAIGLLVVYTSATGGDSGQAAVHHTTAAQTSNEATTVVADDQPVSTPTTEQQETVTSEESEPSATPAPALDDFEHDTTTTEVASDPSPTEPIDPEARLLMNRDPEIGLTYGFYEPHSPAHRFLYDLYDIADDPACTAAVQQQIDLENNGSTASAYYNYSDTGNWLEEVAIDFPDASAAAEYTDAAEQATLACGNVGFVRTALTNLQIVDPRIVASSAEETAIFNSIMTFTRDRDIDHELGVIARSENQVTMISDFTSPGSYGYDQAVSPDQITWLSGEAQDSFTTWLIDPTPNPTPGTHRTPTHPVDVSDALVASGYEQVQQDFWSGSMGESTEADLDRSAQEMSALTGWEWSNEMLFALAASGCTDAESGWEGGGEKSEADKSDWAYSIAPVLGVDANAAALAINALDTSYDWVVYPPCN